MPAPRPKLLAVAGVLLAVAPAAAGCRPTMTAPPAIFTPCPATWHRAADGSCETSGTFGPGQPLPALPQSAPSTSSGVTGQ